ncbi:CAP domain-containing protein [Brachyspira pilosicoli]|uniref:CAP domain-containing protein n=1 Tax=Brachyspira pilosicoli TaxID=52584 RepID=UPI0002E70018|nr:CAP domain-containing protein [Brachyspira pilosicoli]
MKKISLVMIFILISAFALHADVIEDEVFRLINLERSKVSLPPLPNNQRLHSLALYHSDNMAKNKFL